jgi:hypothetical protein
LTERDDVHGERRAGGQSQRGVEDETIRQKGQEQTLLDREGLAAAVDFDEAAAGAVFFILDEVLAGADQAEGSEDWRRGFNGLGKQWEDGEARYVHRRRRRNRAVVDKHGGKDQLGTRAGKRWKKVA